MFWPQALVQQTNRATAETQKLSSDEEGFEPILAWVKALVDDLLAAEFGAPGLEFAWSPSAPIDPAAQDPKETSGIVIEPVKLTPDADIPVGGGDGIMSTSFSIGWSKWRFTYQPD